MLAEATRGLVQRILGPIAARLPRVHPNVFTVCGLFTALAIGWSFSQTDARPHFFLVAAGLAILFGAIDAFDGVLARAQGRVTPYGDFLDHTFDRLSALAALGGLAVANHCNDVIALVLMVATLWHGFLGTQLEASFGRRIYAGVGIGEALVAGFVYSLIAYWILATGRPFFFHVPGTSWTISVTDAFGLAALPLVVVGTFQRFSLARRMARGEEPPI